MPFHDSFMLLVKCMTYNQKAYIEDAMNGFCMQKTFFPFICIIMDDCSTDGEQDTIKNYFQEHFTQLSETETDNYIFYLGKHKTNEKCYFAVYFLKYNHYSIKKSKDSYYTKWQDQCKYIAMCEGDDYWTNIQKLQKQVSFLEEHNDYVLCAHNSIVKHEPTGNLRCFNNWLDKDTYDYCDIISKDWFLPTQSLLFRRDVYYKNKTDKHFFNGDYFLQLTLTRDGGLVYYSNDCMGVYRSGIGVSTKVNFKKNKLNLIDLLNYMSSISDKRYQQTFDSKIERLKQQIINQDLRKSNFNTRWYQFRYKLLIAFITILRFKNPNIMINTYFK